MQGAWRRLAISAGPGAGAVVMGTGIVSISLVVDGDADISRVLMGVALAFWFALGGVLGWRAVADWPRVTREARSPAALTGVAATAVLGSRFVYLGWRGAATAALCLAGVLWLGLMAVVLRHLPRSVPGGAFMLAVGTQSLAVLAAALAAASGTSWLVYLAAVLVPLGLGLYVVVLSRFDLRELWHGHGDHWVAGGALAISSLALAQISLSAGRFGVLGGDSAVLQDLTLAVWAAAAAWLPVLIVAELVKPRLGYAEQRWATVFPLGMYAVCSSTVAASTGIEGIDRFGRIWTWCALVVWAVTFSGLLLHGLRSYRSAAGVS